jgi:outer membrane protein TolC
LRPIDNVVYPRDDITRAQLRVGQVSSASVLTAETGYQQSVQALVQARAARYADSVALIQSPGGGWWNHGARRDADVR